MVLPFQEVMSAAEVVGYGGEGVLPLGAGAAAVGGVPGPGALAVADGGLAVRPEGPLALEYLGEGAVCRRSEEHTSELQSLMRISYAVFCLKKKRKIQTHREHAKPHKSVCSIE